MTIVQRREPGSKSLWAQRNGRPRRNEYGATRPRSRPLFRQRTCSWLDCVATHVFKVIVVYGVRSRTIMQSATTLTSATCPIAPRLRPLSPFCTSRTAPRGETQPGPDTSLFGYVFATSLPYRTGIPDCPPARCNPNFFAGPFSNRLYVATQVGCIAVALLGNGSAKEQRPSPVLGNGDKENKKRPPLFPQTDLGMPYLRRSVPDIRVRGGVSVAYHRLSNHLTSRLNEQNASCSFGWQAM